MTRFPAGRACLFVSLVFFASCAKMPPRSAPVVPTIPSPAVSVPPVAVIPSPVSIQPGHGAGFTLTPATTIVVPAGHDAALGVARYLAGLIGMAVAPVPPRVEPASGAPPAGAIVLDIRAASVAGDESYELIVTPERVTIAAAAAPGLFYGVQTLRQLLPAALEYEAARPNPKRAVVVPAVHILDSPRFSWRGAMLDVARHFMSVEDVKRYIDLLALYKMNRLHLHLADDQGWRIEIASWPKLATEGGRSEVGGGSGGYYTQADYRRLVAYAQERFITIVPEIDMPGHTNAALSSYAELNCDGVAPPVYTGIDVGFSVLCVDKDLTYRFINDIVREIAAITPGPWFHAGGDEVKQLTPARYARFIERTQEIVRSHGKQMIGWDEIAPAALDPTTIVQHWRPKSTPSQAVARGAKIILSPADKVYLDMKYDAATELGLDWAGRIEIRDAYAWEPARFLDGVPEAAILGVEAPLWSETVATMDDVEFLAFPRLAAVAEVAWSRAERRAWEDFRNRLGGHAGRWSALGVNFYRSPQVPWR